MSGDRIASGTDSAEEDTATDGEPYPNRCSQISALCCCIPRRQRSLPGRRPKERKKKKNVGGLSITDIMFEEEMDQVCWNIPVDEQDSVQAENIKPALPLCPQAYGTKDRCISLPIGTFYLEEKKKDQDEKPDIMSCLKQGKALVQPKEGLDDLAVLCSEMEHKSRVGAISEGLPFEEGTGHQMIPVKENRQAGRPKSLDALLQEVAHEKEQQEGESHASIILEGVSCEKAWEKHSQPAKPFQEGQQSGKPEDLKSTLADIEEKTQEEPKDRAEGVTSLQELLSQPWMPGREGMQPARQQRLAQEVPHKVEEQVSWDKMETKSKNNTQKNGQAHPEALYQEVEQPVELKYPESLPIRNAANSEQEMLYPTWDWEPESSCHETEHSYKRIVDQDVQQPLKPKAMSSSFWDKAYETEREVEDIANFMSDGPLRKAEEHPCNPHQVNVQAVAQENKTPFPGDVTCTAQQQKLADINDMPEDDLVYITEQKNLEKWNILLVEHESSTYHHITSHEKEQQEVLDHSCSGSQGISFIEEQETSGLITPENTDTLSDNLSYEKEQQRKLDCGDSGSESLYDKEDQDYQVALYLEGQQPLLLEQLSCVPVNRTSEVEQHTRNSGTLEMHCLEEQQVECGDQDKMFISVSSKEEAEDNQEEQETTMSPSTPWHVQGEKTEAWHTPKATFIPQEEGQQREQFNLDMTGKEHQRKEKQGRSETTFSCITRKDEENM